MVQISTNFFLNHQRPTSKHFFWVAKFPNLAKCFPENEKKTRKFCDFYGLFTVFEIKIIKLGTF
jgi:hypothetical protein